MVIDTLELNIVVDNKGTTARINNTTNALKNLRNVITDINSAGGVNGAVNGGGGGSSSKGGSSRSSGSNSASRLIKNLNFGSMVAKLYFVRNITKQLGQELAKVVQYGIDYEETLNLWQVAMRGNISQAKEFVNTMNKAYGISSATVMNYQATFRNMLSALGNLNEEVSYGLSEALTQMAVDYASLYNTSIEEAMTKFQAVLAGQVRPIRSESGYDITESTIFALYQELGGTKTVRQLDQTEKRMLRILAVYKQMEGVAIGDLSKTIRSSANQLRVMKEQGKEFATWIGIAFNTLLEESGILIEINAYLYALTALAKQFAITLGYVEKDYSIKQPIEETNEELDKTLEKTEALKGKLLGFDKFQVLSSAQTDTESLDIAEEITKAIQEYKRIINDAENPAFKRSLELLQAWGFELDENGNIVGGLENISNIVMSVTSTLGNLLSTLSNIAPVVVKFLGTLSKVVIQVDNAITGIITSLLPIVSSILEPIAEVLEPIGYIIEDIGFLTKNVITSATPAIKSGLTAFLQGLKPILDIVRRIVHMITWAISWFMDTQFAKEFLYVVSTISEFFAKIVDTVNLLISTIANWDWSNLGKNFGELWGTWESSGYKTQDIEVPAFRYKNLESQNATVDTTALFYTNETVGSTVISQSTNTQTLSANDMEDAVATGVVRGFMASQKDGKGNNTMNVYVDGQRLFTIMRGTANQNGYDLVKV